MLYIIEYIYMNNEKNKALAILLLWNLTKMK